MFDKLIGLPFESVKNSIEKDYPNNRIIRHGLAYSNDWVEERVTVRVDKLGMIEEVYYG